MRIRLPTWIRCSSYGEQLLASHFDNTMDEVVEREVQRTLRHIRFQHAMKPYTELVTSVFRMTKFAWEILDGKYWRTSKEVHGSAANAPGGGTGAGFNAPTPTLAGQPLVFTGGFPSGAPTPAVRTFEDAGIRAGEVTAYRRWTLKYGLLYSAVISDFVWVPGEVMEGTPTAMNNEGIYAFKDPVVAAGAYDDAIVPGMVHLWGDVYEHEHGYRASKAAIVSIDDSPDYDAVALRVRYKLEKPE